MSHRSLSSAEIEELFPHEVPILQRTLWTTQERGAVNGYLESLKAEHRCGHFNAVARYRFSKREVAALFRGYVALHRLDRLRPDCGTGASSEEVAAEWERIGRERPEILAWAREHGLLQEVVQEYRFHRRQGAFSYEAHRAAARVVHAADPAIVDPMNQAGVLIEWAEREHRAWFWRCCRDHHVL